MARVDQMLETEPFTITFHRETWGRNEYPKTALTLDCRSPQEDETGESGDNPNKDRPHRWEAHCTFAGTKLAPRSTPAFLKINGSDESYDRRQWFVRGVARELLGSTGASLVKSVRPSKMKASSTLPSNSNNYRVENLFDANPTTAWCEGDDGHGRHSAIEMSFNKPTSFSGLKILPGYTKSDWVYEANGAPDKIRLSITTAGKTHQIVEELELPKSAELFIEGRDALFIPATVKDAVSVTLQVETVRTRKYTKDLCISELSFVP